MKKRTKHPEDLDLDELAEATRQFDRPFVFETARPMTAKERREERRLRSQRSKNGRGTSKVSIALEQSVLSRADALAKRTGLSRSEIIARLVTAGLRRAV